MVVVVGGGSGGSSSISEGLVVLVYIRKGSSKVLLKYVFFTLFRLIFDFVVKFHDYHFPSKNNHYFFFWKKT